MPSPDNQFETLAVEMAERLDRQRAAGQQLPLALDEVQDNPDRRVRGNGKATNQMRDWLAARGLRLPEEVLAEMAGLTSHDDAVTAAMVKAERMVLWAFDGAEVPKGGVKAPTARMRIDAFEMFYTVQLRSLDALLPYGLAKVTPDTAPVHITPMVVLAPQMGAGAKVIEHVASSEYGPPPMPWEMQQNQALANAATVDAANESRIE